MVLALAGLMTVLMAGECGPEGGTNAGGGDQFDYDTVKAKMWKNLDKSAFDNGTVTQVVVSGKNTYVATSDK
ncbi:MAG TPA: hypothetical protein VEK06_04900, partial [Myxococcota bacterium]|nr:hypothetical protein [Myxococcota bacterium]